MDLGLRDKVALVTGGSRGLGRSICLSLADENAKVAINYRRDRRRAVELMDEIQAGSSANAIAVQGDVTSVSDIRRMLDETEAQLGPIDILINNAGVWPQAYVQDIEEEQWKHTLDVNLTGPFFTSRELVRRWLAGGRSGRIVNVSSPAAFRGSTTGHADYAAAKAGLVSFTVSLAREVAQHRIYVNAVAPGMMRTDMARHALDTSEDQYLKRIPLGRIADPSEVAAMVVFLASDRASYTTGATVDVSGGMLMR